MATFGGSTFDTNDFTGFNYVLNWDRFLAALEAAGTSIGLSQNLASNAATAAANSLAAVLAITGGISGVGIRSPLNLPQNISLGTAAYVDADTLRAPFPVAAGAAYKIQPQDMGKALIAESGTLTWTLPSLASLGPLWEIRGWNRSGATLTIATVSPDVIGASSTSTTVPNNTGFRITKRSSTKFELTP